MPQAPLGRPAQQEGYTVLQRLLALVLAYIHQPHQVFTEGASLAAAGRQLLQLLTACVCNCSVHMACMFVMHTNNA
jgi:hypothetical protein